MNNKLNQEELLGVYEICLEAFAGVSAIITHEIRNNMAVINENSGLLDDLALMVGDQGAVPNKKVRHIATSINGQIVKANNLMSKFNMFAHSNDTASATLDVQETLDIMISLTRRKAKQNRITVVAGVEEGIQLTTRPLVFEALLYLCLTDMYTISAQGCSVEVSSSSDGDFITLQLITGAGGGALTSSTEKKAKLLSRAIQAECDISDNRVAIRLPQ
ncbi:hypothetical protein [Desulfopila sp. IMCC35008]|uniref:hypothetical protein n=1 Tax=Desulfopila sp. IMCC35008 TaxID=2653858 RepID=UPI0013D00567|nr:hypothetical protein [Desulfopila sp. IMCC35008]